MKAFLYHVLNHLIIDEYRRKKTASLSTLSEEGYEPATDHSERLFNIFDGRAALQLIQHLPVKYQKVMRMRYIQNLTLKEIALITGQSRNTLAVHACRGLQKLKALHDNT